MQRRTFLQHTFIGCSGLYASPVLLAEDYDLVIQGGRVIDPSANLDVIADLAISAGRVAAISQNIDPGGAQSINASGLLVVPGLIDVHVHARFAELPPAQFLASGVTTIVDGGSRGATNVSQLVDIARAAPNRLRILLNVATLGISPGGRGEFLDSIDPADVGAGQQAIERYRDWIIGVKARLSRTVADDRDQEVLLRAIQIVEPFDLPVMIHIGDTVSALPELLALLRPGDIVTHMYAPTPNGILDSNGRLFPEVIAARERGVLFDFGNGTSGHWSWQVAEQAIQQGFVPDTISSDLIVSSLTTQVFDLPNVLSKFLLLGMSLPEVLRCSTTNAATTFREFKGLGSLVPGSVADITLLELREGQFEFTDNYQGSRVGSNKLFTSGVLTAGVQYG